MKLSLSGFGFLLGYIVMVGVASFLEKFSMRQLSPYQINFLMAIGMLVTAIPALWIKEGSLAVPAKALPLGAPIGLLMAVGSICFVLSLDTDGNRLDFRRVARLLISAAASEIRA